MNNYPDGMTRADLIHVGELPDPEYYERDYCVTVSVSVYVKAHSAPEAVDIACESIAPIGVQLDINDIEVQ